MMMPLCRFLAPKASNLFLLKVPVGQVPSRVILKMRDCRESHASFTRDYFVAIIS